MDSHQTGAGAAARAAALLAGARDRNHRATDRMFIALMLLQWLGGIAAALLVSPRTWIGATSQVHVHVWMAIGGGALLAAFPITLALAQPGALITRHVIALAQMLFSALLIHLTGGRIETHFHVFGSLAFLAFYRDGTVLVTATAVVAADHALRGIFVPQSVFGVLSASSWRWIEHAGWVLFEDAFLFLACARSGLEMQKIAVQRAELEARKAAVEDEVRAQTTELVAARCAAEDSSRAKSVFLANMSHEIRTPMTAILGFADLLLEPSLSENDRRSHVQTIRRNGEHLLSVINDILDISKIEAGEMKIEQIACSPCRIVADVAALMRVRAVSKGLQLDVEYVFPVPESIQCDPMRLRQILMNLVGNAIKFTKHGGVRVIVRTVHLDDPRALVSFEVIDCGIGMTPPELERLFTPFVQVDASMTRRFGGTGLGLAISSHLAELLGGGIHVQSIPGQGSTFTLTVPTGDLGGVRLIEHAREAMAADCEAAVRATTPATLRARILLAEDGPDNQRLISFLLSRAGAQVQIAENGQAALDTALAAEEPGGQPFDLVLMDMQMPVMDGYEATQQLRARGYGRPIVALTAHAMAGDREKCLAGGCVDYLTKPVDRDKLIETVARLVKENAVGATAAA